MQSIDFIRTQGSRTVALQAGGQRGSGLVIGAAHSRIRPYLPILIAGVLMAACAGSPSWKTAQNASSWQANSDGPALQMPSYIYRADALRRQPIVRRATGIAQATEQMARTWYLDPFVRPISTGKSLYAVVFKSGTGFVQRLSIDVVQFPLLEQTAVPPVANQPGMNLDEWDEAGFNPGQPKTNNKFKKAIKDFPRVGHIGFQDHGKKVWYKDIKIKSIDN